MLSGTHWSVHIVSSSLVSMLHSENGPQITYVRDFKAKVHYFRFWCQVCSKSPIMLGICLLYKYFLNVQLLIQTNLHHVT